MLNILSSKKGENEWNGTGIEVYIERYVMTSVTSREIVGYLIGFPATVTEKLGAPVGAPSILNCSS